MKRSVYLQRLITRQALAIAETIPNSRKRKFFEALPWKKLSSQAAIQLVSLAIALGILSMTSSARAALQRGDSNSQVSALQQSLARLGYYQGPLTGFFGDLTEIAVIRFQQAKGLPANGIVDSQTQAALDREVGINPIPSNNPIPTNRTLQRGDFSTDVQDLQKRLQALGYYNGPLTSYFGTLTEKAVIRFQQDRGLIPNGIVDSSTLAALSGLPQLPTPDRDTSTAIGSRPLQLGSTGADVSELQRRLRDLDYYNGPISGDFDIATEGAVIRFQQNSGLVADGIVGPSTRDALVVGTVPSFPPLPFTYTPPAPQSNYTPAASRYSILDLQIRLKERGFYNGVLDGQFGAQTQAAVEAAQRQYGVSRNDILRGRF